MALTPTELLAHADGGQPWRAAQRPAAQDLASAYRDALAVRALRSARGERPRGYKVGFTNRTIWARYGVYAPIWGSVWNTTLSFCEGEGEIALAGLCQPRIEPEAVFGFRHTPPPEAGMAELFAALDWVAPGFEIVQSHAPDWKFSAAETVADGGLHGRLLVGPRVAAATLAADGPSLHARLAGAGIRLSGDGTAVDHGVGANVLDGPLAALVHFVAELRRCPGAADLQPGDVVTTGTWTDAWPVRAGQRWQADFDAPLVPLSVRFV